MPSSAWKKRLNSSHLGISYAVFCLKHTSELQPRSPHETTLVSRLLLTPTSLSSSFFFFFFFLNNPAPPEISPLPLHAALPISGRRGSRAARCGRQLEHRPVAVSAA